MTEREDDARLLERAQRGDRRALESLIAHHAPTVMRFAMKMCRDVSDAEDVLQETLAATVKNVDDLRGDAALSTWLYAVARSFCIKKRRRSKHAPTALDTISSEEGQALPSTEPQPDERLARHEVGEALASAIRDLDDASREVIVLRDVEGLSAQETAEIVGTSVDAVKSRLHRARAELRRRLAPLALEEPTVPSDPACPDIVGVLSRHLEGEIGPDACAAMEAHVAGCASCSSACDSLRSAVAICRTARAEPLPAAAQERVRRVVERVVHPGR